MIIDPSHAAGIAFMVPSLAAAAAVAAGADGLMIEVHNDPAHAKSDGAQSLTPDQFDTLMETLRPGDSVLRQGAELIFPLILPFYARACRFPLGFRPGGAALFHRQEPAAGLEYPTAGPLFGCYSAATVALSTS